MANAHDKGDWSPGRVCSGALLLLVIASSLIACGDSPRTYTNTANPFTTSGTASLSWNPPPVAATNHSGYRVYYGTAPSTYLQPLGQGLGVGDVTTYTVTGLSGGTRYYFAVTTFDTLGNESAYSNEVFKDVP